MRGGCHRRIHPPGRATADQFRRNRVGKRCRAGSSHERIGHSGARGPESQRTTGKPGTGTTRLRSARNKPPHHTQRGNREISTAAWSSTHPERRCTSARWVPGEPTPGFGKTLHRRDLQGDQRAGRTKIIHPNWITEVTFLCDLIELTVSREKGKL